LRIISIDKPKGWTSFDVIRFLKQRFQEKKVGHLGTLDPIATGTLPVFLGKATRLIPLFNNVDKTYRAVFKLGISTDTFDSEGKIIKKFDISQIEPFEITNAVYSFLGEQKQKIPPFSAAKIKGVPLYKLARKGVETPRIFRSVKFYEIEIEKIKLPFLQLRIRCSKGTYIRSMANDLGILLKIGAYLLSLDRTACGEFFDKNNSISIEKIKKIESDKDVPWISPISLLNHINTLNVDDEMTSKIKFGQRIKFPLSSNFKEYKKNLRVKDLTKITNHLQSKVLDNNQNLIAIGFLLWENESCYFQPTKVFL